jgi:hypothetical protein
VFAWRDAVARDAHTGAALSGIASVGAWRALNGGGAADGDGHLQPGSRPGARARGASALHRLRQRAFVAGFPLAVAALNRAGLGPLSSDVSGVELRRAGLHAMDEVAVRLGLGDAYVIFGHTHRAGPLPGDDEREWLGRRGARLLNTGSWTYASVFLGHTRGESPYWPGAGVLVEESGPPGIVRMLQDRARVDIRPIPA